MARPAAGGARGAAFAHINKRNAAANFENAFRNVGARPDGQGGAKAGAGDEAEGEDVFQRRKTRNVNYWSVSKPGGAADAGGARSGQPHSSRAIAATACYTLLHCSVWQLAVRSRCELRGWLRADNAAGHSVMSLCLPCSSPVRLGALHRSIAAPCGTCETPREASCTPPTPCLCLPLC